MKLTIQTTTMPGARLEGENPHPRFRALTQNKRCVHDGSLTAFQQEHYGEACGERTLPYRMQDRYTRSEAPVQVQTAVLENEHLIATFMPEFGGKLWSLFDKDENREILFANEVLRPANLAIRNAWTCGGIEWNLGHTGHSSFTCQTLHCAAMRDADGADFLRMYEYEATEGQILQLDMHLPSGSRQLVVHVRIENARAVDAPVYWWTNTAVPLTEQTRVFSATDEILFQLPHDPLRGAAAFGRGHMPHQPNLGDIDISYPWRIPFSVEYFFQNPRAAVLPWEVAVEADGTGFGERSTLPLFARKMFCWGTGTGGRHWCDYLAQPGKGDYVEIQAGLAPTQNHTAVIPARGVISFTQLIGAFTAPSSVSEGDWLPAQAVVAQTMEETISAQAVEQAHRKCEVCAQQRTPGLFLVGTGYGGLEREKRKLHGEMAFAPHLIFPLPERGDDLYPWLELLRGNDFPAAHTPAAYLTDADWLGLAQPILGQSQEPLSRFQYGVMLAENGREAEARALLEALSQENCAFATHALGELAKRAGDAEATKRYFVLACEQAGANADASFAEDALDAMVATRDYAAAWRLYSDLPEARRTPVMELIVAKAAVALEEYAFLEAAFAKEYACIREGAAGLADIWFELQARRKCRAEGVPFTDEKIDRTLPLPRNLDFRMFG